MMSSGVLSYAIAGVLVFGVGLSGAFFSVDWLRKILAVNLAGSGVFLVLVALANRQTDGQPDPVPHALVLTGIVVAVSATAVALALYGRLATFDNEPDPMEGPGG